MKQAHHHVFGGMPRPNLGAAGDAALHNKPAPHGYKAVSIYSGTPARGAFCPRKTIAAQFNA